MHNLEERHKNGAIGILEWRQDRRPWEQYEQELRIFKLEAEIARLRGQSERENWEMPEGRPLNPPW